MLYIDFHRHIPVADKNILQIQNIYLQEQSVRSNGIFTCGLHPWHLEQLTLKECQNLLTGVIHLPSLLAVGECGLDKNTDFPLELQIEYFRLHILAAKQYHKPLLVHCVRRHGELLQLLKQEKFKGTIIVHGFDSKLSVARQLQDHGVLFSFGSSILKPQHPAAGVLAEMPASSYFLETDDDIYPIEDIYRKAAEIRGCEISGIAGEIVSCLNNTFDNYNGEKLWNGSHAPNC